MNASLKMPLAMHLTILVSLFAVKVCPDTTTASADEEIIKSVPQTSSLTVTTKYNISLSTVTTTNNTQKPITARHPIATAVTSDNETALPSTSSQTTNRTEEIRPITRPMPTVTDQTSNATDSHGPTPNHQPDSESPNNTSATAANTTSPGLSDKWGIEDFAANPGLVVVICIFCIITALVVVVVASKCIRSPSSNFEKLEDLPMDRVNEKSPFAEYSK